mgnify:CR=1 FL=1
MAGPLDHGDCDAVHRALALLGHSDDPAALTGLQALVGAAGTAAAWGRRVTSRCATDPKVPCAGLLVRQPAAPSAS